MDRLRSLRRVARLVTVLAVAGATFGIATAVQADIPDGATIHGCYGKAGTSYQGDLRVVDTSQGARCRSYENPLDWNQGGVTGPTGATGATGPTGPPGLSLFAVVNSDGTLVHGTATGSVLNGSGTYTVTFGQDVSDCAGSANPGSFPGSNISASSSSVVDIADPAADEVTVEFVSSVGLVSTPFFLIVDC